MITLKVVPEHASCRTCQHIGSNSNYHNPAGGVMGNWGWCRGYGPIAVQADEHNKAGWPWVNADWQGCERWVEDSRIAFKREEDRQIIELIAATGTN